MSENILKSLTDITKGLAETTHAAHIEAKADTALLLGLYAILLNKGIISTEDIDRLSNVGENEKLLSDRVKARIDTIKKVAKV
ncbi:hypothetical protein [Brucella cytisi]|uniref:Uncharacterized protein n=1 Tax=Brucella cytisi TaxID=407152 RepID=A0A1J6HUS0_9HYPH|nr:hypothetical protein [Brucella cytisi]OIS91927.1 hypothetical protein BLA27_18600 [Brucella cytisi]